jgi:glutamate-1-semialdehyde 2,1-aminomutase
MQPIQSFNKSKELLTRAREIIPTGTNSGARAGIVFGTYEGFPVSLPSFIEKGQGPYLYDVDGNKFTDYHLGFGAIILGHANPVVSQAVKEQLDRGTSFALNTEAEIKLTERFLKHVPCAEQVALTNSGSEACSFSVRLARAYTDKQKIVKFEGHYHGWHDWNMVGTTVGVMGSPARGFGHKALGAKGVAESVYDDVIVLPWNDEEALEKTIKRQADEIACVIMEGYQSNWGVIPAEKGYLELVRKLTRENDIVFVMDEVINGLRLGLGGAQSFTGVVPDLSPFSKAMANGLPIAAVAGTKKVMEPVASENTFIAGTFNGNPIGTCASIATIDELESRGYSKIYENGNAIIAGIRDALRDNHIPGVVQGPGPMWSIFFTDLDRIRLTRQVYSMPVIPHIRRSALFFQGLAERGIFFSPARYGRMYISFAHTEDDVKKMIEACQESLAEVRRQEIGPLSSSA